MIMKEDCSMTGDALTFSVRFNHVVIVFNESFNILFVELKSNALICHVRVVLVS